MKKLLGLLAVAPMALAACSGNEADKDKDTTDKQTTITEAYENTNYVGDMAMLDSLTDTSTDLNTDYNDVVLSMNQLGLGNNEHVTDELNFMKHDWTIANEADIQGTAVTFNYVLKDDILYSEMSVDGAEGHEEYMAYGFEIKDDKLDISTYSLKLNDSADITVAGHNTQVSYSDDASQSLEAIIVDGEDYIALTGRSSEEVFWDYSALNTASNKSFNVAVSTTLGVDELSNHFTDAERDAYVAKLEAIKIPGTDTMWDNTIAKDAFPSATIDIKYADVVKMFE